MPNKSIELPGRQPFVEHGASSREHDLICREVWVKYQSERKTRFVRKRKGDMFYYTNSKSNFLTLKICTRPKFEKYLNRSAESQNQWNIQKAFEKSKRRRIFILCLSMFHLISSVSLINAVCVLLYRL